MGPYVEAALRNAAEPVDDRGLMDLAAARRRVGSSTTFARGQTRIVDGSAVTDADRLWAALLSLGDAAEFVAQATRIAWSYHPRGRNNIAPHERYGDAILPWLEAFISDGVLVNRPWCVAPCLLEIGTPQGFEVLWKIRSVANASMSRWQVSELEAGVDAGLLLRAWIERHAGVAWPGLIAKAERGDERARQLIEELGAQSPAGVRARLVATLGQAGAEALVRLPAALEPHAILAALDQVAAGELETEFMAWPLFHCGADGSFEYHAMRLIAARSSSGDDWGVVLERLSGCNLDEAMVERYCYGSRVVAPGMSFDSSTVIDIDFDEDWRELEGLEVHGPNGRLVLTASDPEDRDLRPGFCTEAGNNPAFNLVLRAYLHEHPGAWWVDAAVAAQPLQLDDPEIIVVSDDFEHVLGEEGSAEPEMDAAWLKLPSESATFRSLAAALCARDGSLFEPGPSNLKWRRHVKHEEPLHYD